MSEFNIYDWNRKRHLNESQADAVAKAIDSALTSVDESLSYSDFAKGVAKVLKDEYGSHNFGKFMEVLHAELGINEAQEMVSYKVKGVTADPYEGGGDEPFDIVVKVKAGLEGDDLKKAIRSAAKEEMGPIYKINNFTKA